MLGKAAAELHCQNAEHVKKLYISEHWSSDPSSATHLGPFSSLLFVCFIFKMKIIMPKSWVAEFNEIMYTSDSHTVFLRALRRQTDAT